MFPSTWKHGPDPGKRFGREKDHTQKLNENKVEEACHQYLSKRKEGQAAMDKLLSTILAPNTEVNKTIHYCIWCPFVVLGECD